MDIAKRDLIKLIAKKGGEYDLPHGAIQQVLDRFAEVCRAEVKKGRSVYIRELGTFGRRTIKARKALDPNDLSEIRVPKRNYPTFKPSTSWRNYMKGAR